jgi:DNA primase
MPQSSEALESYSPDKKILCCYGTEKFINIITKATSVSSVSIQVHYIIMSLHVDKRKALILTRRRSMKTNSQKKKKKLEYLSKLRTSFNYKQSTWTLNLASVQESYYIS